MPQDDDGGWGSLRQLRAHARQISKALSDTTDHDRGGPVVDSRAEGSARATILI